MSTTTDQRSSTQLSATSPRSSTGGAIGEVCSWNVRWLLLSTATELTCSERDRAALDTSSPICVNINGSAKPRLIPPGDLLTCAPVTRASLSPSDTSVARQAGG
uniref:Uncharacterized protein n=1 Tax=Mesocestoides corti TaxID=53468 RepID=A0A5K3G0Z2_MESCO